MTEREFQRAVVELARLMGWRVHHTRPALTQRGRWLTPIQGDAGFPDLVLCRPPRLVIAELKRVGVKPTAEQQAWLDALSACADVECYLWTPQDWKLIEWRLIAEELGVFSQASANGSHGGGGSSSAAPAASFTSEETSDA
jgi:hypothetical protein